MIHHGQSIFQVAQKQGLSKSSLAKKMGVTSQAVDYIVKRKVIKKEILEEYSKALGVDVSEFQKESNEDESNFYKEKYFELLEETKKLWQIVSQHGIKVDLGKFEVIRLPRVSRLYFFGFTNISNNILS